MRRRWKDEVIGSAMGAGRTGPLPGMIPRAVAGLPRGEMARFRYPVTTRSSRGSLFSTIGPSGPQTTMSSIRAP